MPRGLRAGGPGRRRGGDEGRGGRRVRLQGQRRGGAPHRARELGGAARGARGHGAGGDRRPRSTGRDRGGRSVPDRVRDRAGDVEREHPARGGRPSGRARAALRGARLRRQRRQLPEPGVSRGPLQRHRAGARRHRRRQAPPGQRVGQRLLRARAGPRRGRGRGGAGRRPAGTAPVRPPCRGARGGDRGLRERVRAGAARDRGRALGGGRPVPRRCGGRGGRAGVAGPVGAGNRLGGPERRRRRRDRGRSAREARASRHEGYSGESERGSQMTTQVREETALDELCINTIRTLSMDAVQKANSGHPGAPMGLAPLGYLLYTRVMKNNPANAEWFDRDRFVLSAGHASMLLYSLLYLTGYGLTLDDLKNFRQLGSPTAGHPEYGHAAGIETTTGPLGQGISNSVGMALAERMLAERFNRPGHQIVDHHTYVIASDGDMQEGVQSEAASIGGHLGLGRLIAFYDDNHISIEGDTALSFTEDVGKRYEAYGWHVQNLGEDLELERVEEAIATAKDVTDQPSLIIIRTHIAPGSPNKQDTEGAHGSPLGEEEIKLTKEAYDWPSEEPFFVPQEALDHFRECIERGEELESEWQERFDAYTKEFGDEAREYQRIMNRELP